jgi:hypothetical protein
VPPGELPTIFQLAADDVFIPVAPLIVAAHPLIAAQQRHHAPRYLALGEGAIGLPGEHAFLAQGMIMAIVQLKFIKAGIAA